MADEGTSDEARLLLGIDGGGTKTVAWLAAPAPGGVNDILGRGIAGPGNPRAVGFELALNNIESAIADAFRAAGLSRGRVAAACLALAGAGREAEQQPVLAWARSRELAGAVKVVNDAEPLLAAGTPQGWGVALIAGTGSLAYGRNSRGEVARTGGWGYLFGDEGSGYALAVAGLRAAAQAADGRGPSTLLLERFQQRLGAASPLQLVEAIYAPETTRRQVAELAPLVLQAATDQDAVARGLVEAAARDLARMVATLQQRLQLPVRDMPLALAGSLLLKSELLQELLAQELRLHRHIEPATRHVPEPVFGAVTLAATMLNP